MKKTRILSFPLTGLWVLLVFLLVFDQKINLPTWINPVGRLHPLLLHLPIGLFMGLWLLFAIKKYLESDQYQKIYKALTGIIAILAVVSAIAGFFLSKEETEISQKLLIHKYSGASFALLCVFLFEFNFTENKWFVPTKIFTTLILIISGHLGGEITHGENYLFANIKNNDKRINDQSNIYLQGVYPILEKKCVTCHNDQKTKGKLNMTSIEKLLKGGKNGAAIKIGDALNSHIISRASLPLDDKKHMPPKGKPQLTEQELKILVAWINNGAPTKTTLAEIKNIPSFYNLFLEENTAQTFENYDFKAINQSTLNSLNTPFCTVEAIAIGSPGIKASFYVSQKFDGKTLEKLQKVSDQLIELNLSKMPLTEKDFEVIVSLGSLRKLNINATGLKSDYLKNLSKLKKLNSLSISNNPLDNKALDYLSEIKSLKNLYIWESGLSDDQIKNWAKKNKGIVVETGFNSDNDPPLKLNPPTVLNKARVLNPGQKIELKHSLKGVEIRYTLDGSDPDSIKSKIYTSGIAIENFSKIKMKAYKSGWLSSDIIERNFFTSNIKSIDIKLLSQVDKKYLGNGPITLIDGKEGDFENIRDGSWLGYRDNDAVFIFNPGEAKGISLSWLVDPGGYIMPPKNIQIFSSHDGKRFTLLENKQPLALQNYVSKYVGGLNLLLKQKYNYIKVSLKPLSRLPAWHQGKGQKGWVFIDEVYLW